MAKFRKKPIVIEAEQWRPADAFQGTRLGISQCQMEDRSYIHTLEGKMELTLGDWIITGVRGERYPCKPDIFAATYEAVE